jgi:2-oxo-3-hexenedioate decarboxylase
LRRLRQARGEQPAGRKIGFTNRDLWAQYNIDRPVWGDMYAQSVRPLDPSEPVALAPFCEPLIEPEIVLRLARAPEPGMDEAALLHCLAWVAHGFEIVHSIYPGWKVKVADTIAAFGMHGALRIGEPLAVTPGNRDSLFADLTRFTVTIAREGVTVDAGCGANVLGGPLSALRHLVELLNGDPHNPQLSAGEIVTTGTLTRAYPIRPGETWSTSIAGIPLAGLSIRLG